ncbi:hypothetical protein LJC04_02965 [Ruminococcaceae bacterium OttesenSCG-928-O06]|nr:hypothetical protein [Ruminococcaceae bacterium OttesenSCG-928-O06]
MNDLNVEFGYAQTDKKLSGIDPDKKVSKYKPGGLDFRIERFTPHQLCHTFCTNCYYAEEDVQTCMA